jgi:Kef-type K+ transport system membrane component KefB
MQEWIDTISQNPYYEFTLILLLAAVVGGIGQLFKQPLIVMFIFLGIIVGPTVLDIVKSKDNIHLLADIGIAVLLFIVGLKLDLRLIKSTGKIALLTGLGQVIFTSVIGYFIGVLLEFSPMHSFYIAVALTFSSTIIIVKLLSDKKEIDSLHGQISIGFLIVQDMVVIFVMIVLSALGKREDFSLFENIMKTLLSSGILVAITYVTMTWIIPGLSRFLAKSQELLVLFALAWALTLGSVSHLIGFSSEVGAFLAGVSLASSAFKETISSRLVSLRDFLLLFFFVNLGANLNLSAIGSQVSASVIFSLFVLVGNPIIVLVIMGLMGYRKRTSFLAGLTVAQISEFSLIFAGLGLAIGHINEEVLGLITLVGIITIALSTYLIIYSHRIYDLLAPALTIFEKKNNYQEPIITTGENHNFDLIIFGLGRFGNRIAKHLDNHPEVKYLGVDFDPQIVRAWQLKGKPVIYGDMEDSELLEQIPFFQSKLIISTIPDKDYSMQLVKQLRERNYGGKIFLTAIQDSDYKQLKKCNADSILMPYRMAAENFYNSFISAIVNKNREHFDK